MSDKREWNFGSGAAELDSAVEQGQTISPFSSGLLGVLRVGAQDAKQLITVARGVLNEVWIAGSLQTNERFIAELLEHPWVREGIFHAGFVDEEFLPAIRPPKELLSVFATACSLVPSAPTGQANVRWAVGDQWVKPDPEGLRWKEGPFIDHNSGAGLSGVAEIRNGRTVRVCAYPLGMDKWQVRVGAWTLAVRRVLSTHNRSSEKNTPRILALTPGRVHSVLFKVGAIVPAHEPLLMIESLGMLVPHAVPADVRILRWKISAEDCVKAGDDLVDFEVVAHGDSATNGLS
jgi:acetyl/propionyl-CoA carboxylase alpha subunit